MSRFGRAVSLARPVKVFLSYRRRDAREVTELQRAFAIRGLSLWRDVSDLPLGGLTIPEIKRGIRKDSDAFVLYVTRWIFSSDVVWGTEVPEASSRSARARRSGGLYPVVPLIRYPVTLRTIRSHARRLGVAELTERNAEFVPRRGTRPTPSNRRLAYENAARRLLRSLLRGLPSVGRTRLAIRSFDATDAPPRTLDIDWSGLVDGTTPHTWTHRLRPALKDLRSELARAQRRELDVYVKARLQVALAFGLEFPPSSGFRINVRDRQGSWSPAPGRPVLHRAPDRSVRRHKRVVLEISLAQNGERSARKLAKRLKARHVRLVPPTGQPSRAFDPRPVAGRIAVQAGELARELHGQGMSELHLVFVGPAALALLVGRQLQAIGRVHSYFLTTNGLVRAFTS